LYYCKIYRTEAVIKKHLNHFITLKEALDLCVDFRDETGFYIDFTESSSKTEYSESYYNLRYQSPYSVGRIINADLYSLLHLVQQNQLALYGQKTETVKKIKPIDINCIDKTIYLNKAFWSKDLSSIFYIDELLYTNLCIKKDELIHLIKSKKLQTQHAK
jgi:hypothetical protein